MFHQEERVRSKTRIATTVTAAALALSVGSSSAFAHHRTNANKQAGADDECDGQAIDNAVACMGIPHGK